MQSVFCPQPLPFCLFPCLLSDHWEVSSSAVPHHPTRMFLPHYRSKDMESADHGLTPLKMILLLPLFFSGILSHPWKTNTSFIHGQHILTEDADALHWDRFRKLRTASITIQHLSFMRIWNHKLTRNIYLLKLTYFVDEI